MKTLYWVTQDLRIHDNLALQATTHSEALLCVYIVDPCIFKAGRWQTYQMGSHRWRFLQQSLKDFETNLLTLGQKLHIVYGDTLDSLTNLCLGHDISHLIATKLAGSDEKKCIETLSKSLPDLKIDLVENYTLLKESSLPFSLDSLPKTYSAFRKKMADVEFIDPQNTLLSLPPMPKAVLNASTIPPAWLPTEAGSLANTSFHGGETRAQKHLVNYFNSSLPGNYKHVRNALDGWNNSSKLAPWINLGCLSPRQVKSSIDLYEKKHGSNESTQWLLMELLWREYFQWLHHSIGSKLFKFDGITGKSPLTSFYAERFNKWKAGLTPYPLVNACMNELRSTGYLSNRGRQIAASCLVNELALDWRYGAAWFEQQLIDYDVAVNWGNWQYIAGIGADPRGGRHFNIEKQTNLYDPDGLYQNKWQGRAHGPLDSVDAADWPIPSLEH